MAKKNRLTKKQLQNIRGVEKQLTTWEKHHKENDYNFKLYHDIRMKMEADGILTPTGKISRSKKKYKEVEKFIKEYKSQYGSYTSYMRKQKEKHKEFKEEMQRLMGIDKYDIDFDEFQNLTYNVNENIKNMFASIPSGDARKILDKYRDEPEHIQVANYVNAIDEFLSKERNKPRSVSFAVFEEAIKED